MDATHTIHNKHDTLNSTELSLFFFSTELLIPFLGSGGYKDQERGCDPH